MTPTLAQQRALDAYKHVQGLASPNGEGARERKSYGSFAHKFPVLIRTAGLCQALHFLRSRTSRPMAEVFLGHLAQQLHRVDQGVTNAESLCDVVHKAPLLSYLALSREAIAVAEWYARLAQSVLGFQPGDDDEAASATTGGTA